MLKLKFLEHFFNKNTTKTDTDSDIKTPAITPTQISNLLHQDPTMCLWYDCAINRISAYKFMNQPIDYSPFLARSAISTIKDDPVFSEFKLIAIAIYTIPISRYLGYGNAHPIMPANKSNAPVCQLIMKDTISDKFVASASPIGLHDYLSREQMAQNIIDDMSMEIMTNERFRHNLLPNKQH